jgi:hypothetical protein
LNDVDLDLERIPNVFAMLLARHPDPPAVRAFAARHPGCTRIDTTEDPDTLVMRLVALDGSESLELGTFPLRELRHLEPDELAAIADGRRELLATLDALGSMELGARFPAEVPDGFADRAGAVVDALGTVAQHHFGGPLEVAALAVFADELAVEGLPIAAEGCRRVIAWGEHNGRRRASTN